MQTAIAIKYRLQEVFTEPQATVLSNVIAEAYNDLIKVSDFNELKGIVKELGIKVGELAEAQKRTEIEIQGLAKGLKETRGDLGGLSRSMSYAFENEAYRMLPQTLKQLYGIQMKERFIRTEISGKEINILGRAKMDGRDVVVVGEVKLRLDERRESKERDVFKELNEKVAAVQEEYKEEPVKILVTHYATKGFIKKAKEKGVIVVQSFEW